MIEITPYYLEKYFNKVAERSIKIDIRNANNPEYQILKEGFIVHRHLLQGDYVLMNRQPTLHRQSIMAMKVVPHNQYTFMLSPGIVAPWNCDFDGRARCHQQVSTF